VIKQLVPVAEQLSPTLIALSKLAPQAQGFFEGLEPVIERAPKGFPALRKLLRDQFPPLLRALDPFLRNLNPFVSGLNLYKHELTAAFANVSSMSNPFTPNGSHYIRAFGPFNPESLATFPTRTTTNRTNAYAQPLAYEQLASGLPVFDARGCTSGVTATLDPETPNNPAFYERVETKAQHEEIPTKKAEAEAKGKTFESPAEIFFNLLKKYAYAGQTDSAAVPAPGCSQQGPFDPIGRPGPATAYQHYYEQSE
jgi:hypothetical protein